MTTHEKIVKAKVQLVIKQPFFANLALPMDYIPDYSVKTACTNGKVIKYNPDFIESLPAEELKGLLAHEVLHIAFFHHTRRGNRDPERWNVAADYAINPLLIQSGFVLPKGALSNARYSGKTAEKIYDLLPEQPPKGGPCGEVEDLPGNGNPQEAESTIQTAMIRAAMIAKRRGKLPDCIDRMIKELLKPKINWREVLARFLSEIVRTDYNWKTPSPRYLHTGLYLPSLQSEEPGRIILIVDTSGSINGPLLNQFAAEVQEIANTYSTVLLVLYVDTAVQGIQEIEPDEPVRLTPKGGGGTDFKPGFEYIAENDLQPKAIIYLTDGACYSFPEDEGCPVLWAQFGDYPYFSPPFGEVLHITN